MQGPTIAALTLGGILALEGLGALARHSTRGAVFAAAAERAQRLGRPLLVVGDPDSGMHTRLLRAYGCGDICVDLNGCPACPVAMTADITKPLNLKPDSVVVFVSCVFEYVDDPEAAYRELLRVAGSRENLFIVTVQPWTLTASLYPGATWAGHAGQGQIAMAPVPGWRKMAVVGGLLGLAAYATSPWWWRSSDPALPEPKPHADLGTG